ncbi:MAG: hypothetical protein MPJ24_00345 [Pirellulaceae bacterium]|nr:hypothetical protein [Pirellulaceae bacterium]
MQRVIATVKQERALKQKILWLGIFLFCLSLSFLGGTFPVTNRYLGGGLFRISLVLLAWAAAYDDLKKIGQQFRSVPPWYFRLLLGALLVVALQPWSAIFVLPFLFFAWLVCQSLRR